MPWLRPLVLTVESRVPSQANVWRFVVDKVTLETGFPPSTSVFLCQYRSTNTSFICMLVLPEGQTGEAWDPSKKQCSFGNRETLDIKVFSLLIVLPSVTFPSPQYSKCKFEAIRNVESLRYNKIFCSVKKSEI